MTYAEVRDDRQRRQMIQAVKDDRRRRVLI
jgi:hypothetical protein